PDFYVFDAQSQLVYRGAFDSSRPKSDTPVSGEYLRAAIESALTGNVFIQGSPALGCGIKWLNAQTNSD
nr:thioredoxin family protein [Actinomycetes bacterium]